MHQAPRQHAALLERQVAALEQRVFDSTIRSAAGRLELLDQPILREASRAFLRVTIMLMWVGLAIYTVVHFLYAPTYWQRMAVSMVLVVVGAASWLLLSVNRVQAAVLVFGGGVWASITLLTVLFGGVAGSAVFLYPLIILLAGWLISVRAAWVVAAVTIVVVVLLVVAGEMGMLPHAPPVHATARAVTQCFTFVFAASIITYVVRSYQRRLAEMRKLSDDLAERTARLQATQADLNRAQAVARMGSWVYDIASDRMVLSNETCRIFGIPAGVTGDRASYLARVHAADRERVAAAWDRAIDHGESFDDEHRILIGKRVRWVRQCGEFQRDADDKPLRSFGTTQDITRLKETEAARALLEAQLRESQKMEALGTLAGGIAHDFNNVLAAIMGNASVARQDLTPGHPAQQSLDEIERASARARALVQQILAFGRRQITEKRCISLAPVIEDATRLLRATQPANIDLNVQCAHDAPLVLADATQVAQVLVNLCTNAWHAMEGLPRRGVVNVSLTAEEFTEVTASTRSAKFVFGNPSPGCHACLRVSDNGAGMSAETLRRIFEPFFTTKPVGKGTGLGLAVVHGIVQAHDACIAVESVPGVGTAFSLYFSQVQAAEPQTPEPRAFKPQAVRDEGAGQHVLYLDDDEALVLLVTRVLRRRGYRVSGYTAPEEALAAVRANPSGVDLVVTDYNMPGTSGLVVARMLKALRPDLPVAMASGYVTDSLREEAAALGVSELMQKPDSVDELCNMVARLVGTPPAALRSVK
jgi:signal transduction histidine kinase/ActR/RegA family two-component response regulator